MRFISWDFIKDLCKKSGFIFLLLSINFFLFSAQNSAAEGLQTKPKLVSWSITSPYKLGKLESVSNFKTFDEFKDAFNSYWQQTYAACKANAATQDAILQAYYAANHISNGAPYGYTCFKYEASGVTPQPNSPLLNGDPLNYKINGTITSESNVNASWNYTAAMNGSVASKIYTCPQGWSRAGDSCEATAPETTPPDTCSAHQPQPQIGHPINAATGNKERHEIDYESADGLLKVERRYVSQFSGWAPNTLPKLQDLHSQTPYKLCFGGIIKYQAYDLTSEALKEFKDDVCVVYSVPPASSYRVYISLDNGFVARFKENPANTFVADNGLIGSLVAVNPLINDGASWEYTSRDNSKKYFDADGFLIRTLTASGRKLSYTYSANKLSRMTDDSGRSLDYAYDTDGNLSSIGLPDGNAITYSYQSEPVKGTLSKVTFPDGSFRSFFYNETGMIAPSTTVPMRALTGQTDELGNRIGTYKYNAQGQAISTETSLSLDKSTLSGFSGSTTITDALGSVRTMGFQTMVDGTKVVSSQSQPAGSGCAASSKNLTYNASGLVTVKTEFNGNITLYGYNSVNFEDRRVEGLKGYPDTSLLTAGIALPAGVRKISTDWYTQWRTAQRIAEPKKITTYVYHGQPDPFNSNAIASCAPQGVTAALLCKKVEQGTTDVNGASGFAATLDATLPKREWRYTYNELGKTLTVVAPQNILTNTVGATYEYYTYDSNNWKKGDLKQVTNALGQITQYVSYDLNGRVLEIIKPDGSDIKLGYDLRGRLTSSRLDGDLTSFAYDLAGNLISTTSPTGAVTTYTYDAAHRLTAMSDTLGNRIEYTLDNAGNITNLIMRDTGGTLRYQQQKVYDALSRVKQVVDTKSNTTTLLYDASGNPTGVTDPKQQNTTNAFTALNQLKTTTDALNGKIDYTYDNSGRVSQVKDPRGNSTVYSYNAFGDLISLVSPDTGTTTFTYDAAGNRISATNARGIVVNYAYDALSRLTSVSYPASASENVLYTYDDNLNGNYGIGRLTGISSNASTIAFNYNHLGLITKKFTQIGSTLSTVSYSYDASSNLAAITYPLGRTVTYTRDAAGRVQGVTTQASANATAQTLLSSVSYLPFGPANSYTYGNGLSHTATYDNDYRLTAIQVGGILSRDYTYDATDNITGISDIVSSNKNQTFGYDALNRLTSATGLYGSLGYTYDSVGNRLQETSTIASATTTDTYSYAANNNRLNSITKTGAGSGIRSFTYDNAGNRTQGTSDAGVAQTFSYNNANRLSSITSGITAASYQYNVLGQRVSKTVGSVLVELYHYNENGQVISVTDANGITQREYIYMDSQLVGFIAGGNTYYVHNDHHNTPQVVTAQNQSVVYMADYKPFGKLLAGQTNSIELYSRFPGQSVDSETGLYYNYFRDYDPSIGRYIESDPIGLGGGINTYAYVGGNPIARIDPSGLLFGGLINAGECYGESSAQYWADKQVDTGNWAYGIPGAFASLWTPATSDNTAIQLAGAYFLPGASSWAQWGKNPAMYELGAKTVSTEAWGRLGLADMSLAERGAAIWGEYGLSSFGLSGGPWLATLAQGPTPGGWLFTYGLLNYLHQQYPGKNPNCGCQ